MGHPRRLRLRCVPPPLALGLPLFELSPVARARGRPLEPDDLVGRVDKPGDRGGAGRVAHLAADYVEELARDLDLTEPPPLDIGATHLAQAALHRQLVLLVETDLFGRFLLCLATLLLGALDELAVGEVDGWTGERCSQTHGCSSGCAGRSHRSSASTGILRLPCSPSRTAGRSPALTALRIVAS